MSLDEILIEQVARSICGITADDFVMADGKGLCRQWQTKLDKAREVALIVLTEITTPTVSQIRAGREVANFTVKNSYKAMLERRIKDLDYASDLVSG